MTWAKVVLAAGFVGGLCVAAWSYRAAPHVERWRLGLAAVLWPLALVGYAIELIENAWRGRWKGRSRRDLRFDDLILVNSWTGSLAAIAAAVVVLFVLFGLFWPYWRVADMDLPMIYEAWLFNDRLPQEWFDHPGYLTILLLGLWFRLLHALHLLDVHALSGVPMPLEADHAWAAAARAGRVCSLLIGLAYLLGFAVLLRRVVKDWRIAILAMFALAFSGGFAMQSRIIRTELIASGAVVTALLLLILAARDRASAARPALVGLAAFCATLAVINKVHAVFLVCALPLMVFPFGAVPDQTRNVWQTSAHAKRAAFALAIAAMLIAIPAAHLILEGLAGAASMPRWHPFLLGTFGAYQAMIAVWIAASMIAYAFWWRVPARETLAALACVLAGTALALLLLALRHHPENVVVVVNPLEQLRSFADLTGPQSGATAEIARELLRGLGVVASTRTFFLETSARPTIFLEWFVIAAAVWAWKTGHRRLVLQVAVLMLVVWSTDAISAIRGLKQQYFILTDPLVIVAAALLLAELPALRASRWAFALGFALLALDVAFSQAEPIKHTFQTGRPIEFCTPHFHYTQRIERFPFCPP